MMDRKQLEEINAKLMQLNDTLRADYEALRTSNEALRIDSEAILKDVFRNTKVGVTDMVMELACALHNLRVSFRHPLPTFDILTLAT